MGLGSRGDTQPCAALAHALGARGHDVVLIAPERYAHLAGGVGFAGLGVDPAAVVESAEGRAWLRSGPLGFVRGFRQVVEPLAEKLVVEVDAACAGADMVLAPALGAFGRHLHDKYGVPYRILQFQPSEPTSEFLNPLFGGRSSGRVVNRASYAVVERLAWVVLGRMVNRLRGRVLGLGPLRGSAFVADRRDRVPVLCGVSPLVVPRPRDWPSWVHMTGYWRMPSTQDGGQDVQGFLEDGEAPVFVGFGSMVPDSPERVAEQVVAGLRIAGMRGIVQGLPVEGRDDVLSVGEVDHAALFRRVAAVVHHGGAGTTAAGLTAGVPSVVCPFFSDQPFWGRRVAELGVGPAPLPIAELTARELGARLLAVPGYRERAAQLGRRLRVEDGVKNAVVCVEGS